jgi:biopolymer transport protein ExbB
VPTDDQITRNLRIALLDAKTDLETGLTALATIGNTAPFVGLFGTVWSIFNALVGIEGEGPVMINQVAGPVGEALIMTAAGLFVAIPAVIAYNALVRSNRVVLAELDGFARDLQAMPR